MDFSWKNKQTKKSNKRLAKNKIIAKKRAVVILLLWKYFREIAFICWFKKLSCPYMSDKKKKAWRKLKMRASGHLPAHARWIKYIPAGRCLIAVHWHSSLQLNINRNWKLKRHDCDLSYSFIKIAPEKHEVGAKGEGFTVLSMKTQIILNCSMAVTWDSQYRQYPSMGDGFKTIWRFKINITY